MHPSTLPPAPEKVDLGQILVRDGLLKPEQLEECLLLQREAAASSPGGPPPRLGEILVRKGYVAPEAVARALGEQARKILFCPRCNILVNVETRPDAIGYSCGRCHGPLVEPPPGRKDQCSDSSIIVNSTLPVPPEVESVRHETTRRFGKYILLGQIGRGGIADVHRAWDTYLHQYVALKRLQALPQELADPRHSRVASLLNEAHNMVRLRHPNIVSVYDIGRIGQHFYISMEYLDGRTLWDEIKERREAGRVSPWHEDPGRWMGVLFQVAHALHYAHTRPLPTLHCDLKPGNVFVTREGRVCVLDFGLARHLGESQGDMGMISGTPSYMSPEQAQGRSDELDARTDVYGLGATLYELLTGQPPFTGTMGEVLRRTITERPEPPGQVLARLKVPGPIAPIPAAIEELCLKCLEKDRNQRPPTALAVAEEVERVVGRAGSARPTEVHPPVLSGPPAPRRPSLAWAAVAAGFLLAGAAGYLVSRAPSRGNPPAARAAALRHLVDFRPELVNLLDARFRREPEFVDLLHRAEAIAAFKERLVEAVSVRKPFMPELRLTGRTLRSVRISRAKLEGILFVAAGDADDASWESLGPSAVAELARACGVAERPEDRYGLGVYLLTAGDPRLAREIFDSLKGTGLETATARWLSELGGR
jgi:serine/threonine protein kinase